MCARVCATRVSRGSGREKGREGGIVCHVNALTVGFGLPEKRGYGVEVEKIQFAMITLSACS